ncbi:hypothetical protein [Glutamicibacter sp. PS]|uniref:hypothetical protein n=1 Tax=Glutamicibacter sp. PS TaxID=3075634 RepID=UPI00284487EF|nr:hypothetical protein [Glutamicibacter sp. PS]MDR4533112.1 hypothetical protein [Glutamicibacter sp. PS]
MTSPKMDPGRAREARAQLIHMVHAGTMGHATTKRPRLRRTGVAVGSLVSVSVVAVMAQLNITAAQAHHTLQRLADISISNSDQKWPGKDEYLKIGRHTWGGHCVVDVETGAQECNSSARVSTFLYIPGDPDNEWVLEGDNEMFPQTNFIERAIDGQFGDTPGPDYQDMIDHATSGATLYAYVNATYSGASASRAESNFVRLTDALGSEQLPAEKRAMFYAALTHVSGVSIERGVKTHDGKVGIAIGRNELLRHGIRQEIIVSPDSGQVIGSRQISSTAIMGVGPNEIISSSTVDRSIVDAAP